MATRIYLPSSGSPPLASLAVNSQWELTNGLVRLPCFTAKQNTPLTTKQGTWPATVTQQWCWYQFQSEPLQSAYNWLTTDTVSMVIGKCGETSSGGDSHLNYVVRVVSGDGATIRGVIGSYLSTAGEFPLIASAATRIHTARTNGATAFSSQVGDRIIIEIGLYGATPVAEQIQMRVGDPSGLSDFALTAGLTTDLCPWVELSRTVEFGTAGINGALAVTFDDMVASGAGTVDIAGTTSLQMGDTTLAAEGDLDIAGSVSATFADTTLAAEADLEIQGDLSATFGDMAVAGEADLEIQGSASLGFEGTAVVAEGDLDIGGNLAVGMEGTVLAGTGQLDIGGVLSAGFEDMTLDGHGTVGEEAITGSLDVTFDDMTVTGQAGVEISGSLGVVFGDMTLEADGQAEIQAVLSTAFDDMGLTGAGALDVSAIGGIVFEGITLQGQAAVDINGQGGLAFDGMTVQGTGVIGDIPITGSLAVVFGDMSVLGVGIIEGAAVKPRPPVVGDQGAVYAQWLESLPPLQDPFGRMPSHAEARIHTDQTLGEEAQDEEAILAAILALL